MWYIILSAAVTELTYKYLGISLVFVCSKFIHSDGHPREAGCISGVTSCFAMCSIHRTSIAGQALLQMLGRLCGCMKLQAA